MAFHRAGRCGDEMDDPMKLAYSTYGLQTVDPLEAVDRVKAIGYDALELNVGDDWPTAPAKLDGDSRQSLRDRYEASGFPSPVLMHLINVCAVDEDVEAKIEILAGSCQLANDLNFDGRGPVITTTLGGQDGTWQDCRESVAERLLPYARVAEDNGITLALEAHVGQEFDSPEKAVWLVEAVDHPAVRLNFDHSHFHVLGMELQHCVDLCAPYTVHTHLKDGSMVDGKVRFLIPGDGDLDLQAYFRATSAAGIGVPITAEVSGQIWQRPDYDPWETAAQCYRAMKNGMERAARQAAD